MINKYTGIVKTISEPSTGFNKSGNEWKKIDLVLTDADPRFASNSLSITFWNDKAEATEERNLKEGDLVEIEYFLTSEEYDGKWFTKVTGRSVTKIRKRKEDRDADLVKELMKLIVVGKKLVNQEQPDKESARGIKEIILTIGSNVDLSEHAKGRIIAELPALEVK